MNNNSSRRRLLATFVVLTMIGVTTFDLTFVQAANENTDRPNIILCMADDLGWGDTAFNGHPHIKTPNLDQMAKAGVRLDRFYVGSPLCVPSRAGFLTGRIAIRCGISNHRGAVDHLKAEELTIAELLKSNGYTTGHFGKWHLGQLTKEYKGDKSAFMTPGMAGFDEWFASPSSVATHDPYTDPGGIGRATGGKKSQPKSIDLHAGYIHNGHPLKEPIKGCAAEIVMDRAIPFIRNAAKKKQPCLAVIWFNPPHTPVVGHPKYMKEHYSGLPENQQHYFSLPTAIDAQMGRLRNELRDLGIAENTLLTFTSDNGPGPPISKTRKPEARLQGSAGPFRERKASLYEGGIREPGLVEWPGQLKPGTVIKTPCSTLDYMPTIAAMLGLQLPDRPYDGIDIMPILKGEQQTRNRQIAFYFRDAVALSGDRYKLISSEQAKGKRPGGAVDFAGKKFELFDLENDPGETNDVADQRPELVQSMTASLREWVDSIEASRLGQDYDSVSSKDPSVGVNAPAPRSGKKKTHLFLLSGQSNMKNMDPAVSFTPAIKQAFPGDEVIVTKVLGIVNDLNAEQPNVVVLFADDAGYADFGFQPNVISDMAKLTPHIDSIAVQGARCSQAYVTGAVCSPSRAGLMTGRYQERFGHETNLPPGTPSGLPLTETFGVKRLQEIGYRTGLIGKWHLGYPAEFHPNKRGYGHFYGLLQGSRSYYPYDKPTAHRVILDNDTPTAETGYLTDRLGDAACAFIEANKSNPFYLFVSFTAPHGPLEPRKNSDDAERVSHVKEKNRRGYAGLVIAMDDNVGKILAALEENGLKQNTLVIFTNDNGGPKGTGTSNFPLKGHKGSLEEGGIRVPWAMSWPGVITPGSVIDEPIIALDILPTVFDIAQKPIDPAWNLDGCSLLPLIKNPAAKLPQRSLFWRRKGVAGPIAVRDQNWKLINQRSPGRSKPELYDLATDIGEANDVAAKHPDVVARLQKKLDAWESQLVAPLWGPGSPGFAEKK